MYIHYVHLRIYETKPRRARPWLLRMELNREAVFDKRLDVVEIAKKVVAYFDGGLHVIRSDQNSEKLVSLFCLYVIYTFIREA